MVDCTYISIHANALITCFKTQCVHAPQCHALYSVKVCHKQVSPKSNVVWFCTLLWGLWPCDCQGKQASR